MAISASDLNHLCYLAKLAPDEATKERLTNQFNDIVNYIDKLAEVNTDGIEPLYSPVIHKSAVREDIAVIRQTSETILANAPETDGKYFIVPRIVEGK